METNIQTTPHQELQSRLGNVSDYVKKHGGKLISYSGPIDTKTGDSIITLVERSVLYIGGSRSEMKRVCKVLIDCCQNVIKHGWIDELGETFIQLTIEYNSYGYQIHCRNIVDLEMASTLQIKLNEVNSLNLSQLRTRYVDALCKVDSHHIKGVGLGLLSMAERCTGPLEYELIKEDSHDLLLFSLTVTVKR